VNFSIIITFFDGQQWKALLQYQSIRDSSLVHYLTASISIV